MNNISEKEWMNDFQDFMRGESTAVPQGVTERIFSLVRKDLNPSAWICFSKLFGIHLVVGTLSLSICDQFGMNPFGTGFSLSTYFMKFGHSVCMSLCGFVFFTLSLLLAWILLSRDEMGVVRKNSWIQLPSLALLSLAVFAAFGAQIFLAIGILWFLGAMASGTLMVHGGWKIATNRLRILDFG